MSLNVGEGISGSILEAIVFRDSVPPATGREGDLWCDTSLVPPVWKKCTDTTPYTWVSIEGGGGGAPASAEYLVISADATLTDERVFTPAGGIAVTDGGAGGNYTVAGQAVSAGTQVGAAGATVLFQNSPTVTFGMSDSSVVTASAAGGAGGGVAVSAAGNSVSNGTVVFSNANGVSFGMAGSTVTASHNGLTSQSNQAVSGSNGSFTFQTVSFSNANGISIGTSAGPALTFSHNALTSQSNQALSGSNGSFTFQTATFGSSNGLHFYTTNGSLVGSYTVPTQSNQTLGLYAVGNTTGQSSSSTFDARTISFVGQGIASVGYSAGSVNISVPTGAPSPVNFSAGTTSGDLGSVVFSNSNGVSFGLSGSTITASVAGGGVTLSGFDGFANNELMAIAGGQASLWVDRLDLPCAVQFDRFGLRITHSNATNSSGSATISVWLGISTRNASTLTSVASTSFTTAITASGTAGSYSNYGGIKVLPIPWTTTLTAGNYWLGIVSRTTTGGANMTFGNLANSQINSTMSGYFGSGSNATNAIRLAVGVYSATTAGMPTAISITQIQGNSSAFLRQPAYLFMSNIF